MTTQDDNEKKTIKLDSFGSGESPVTATATKTRKKPGPKPKSKARVLTGLAPEGAATEGKTVTVGTYWIGTFPVGRRQKKNESGGYEDLVDMAVRPDHGHPPRTNIIVPEVGICFPARTNPITRRDRSMQVQDRTEFLGGIIRLSIAQVELLADVLKRAHVRWRSRGNQKSDYGHIIVVPTSHRTKRNEERLKMERKQFTPIPFQDFVPMANDEPLSKWIYMVKLADDALNPPIVRNEDLPGSILTSGIELP